MGEKLKPHPGFQQKLENEPWGIKCKAEAIDELTHGKNVIERHSGITKEDAMGFEPHLPDESSLGRVDKGGHGGQNKCVELGKCRRVGVMVALF